MQMDSSSKQSQFWVSAPSQERPIKVSDNGLGSLKPVTIPQYFQARVTERGNVDALFYEKHPNEWASYTWKQYGNMVEKCAKSLLALGLERFRGVGILGTNAPEWFFAHLAAIHAGGVCAGIYPTNGPEACEYVLADSEAQFCFVQDEEQLRKLLEVRGNLPNLKGIILWKGEVPKELCSPNDSQEPVATVYDWTTFIEIGVTNVDMGERFQSVLDSLKPSQCAAIIYTSGTTGNPKGAMLSHDNIVWLGENINTTVKMEASDVMISFLPLSHVAAMMLDIYGPMGRGFTIYFARPDALKGSLLTTLKAARPTHVMAVPRVWEKMAAKLQEMGSKATGLKASIATWAKGVGLEACKADEEGRSRPWGYWFANAFIFKKIRAGLGLDRAKYLGVGAAPLSRENHDYFASIGCPICECFGMSEISAVHAIALVDKRKIGSCGPIIDSVETKIVDPDKDGNGELCVKGRHVFLGYLNKPEETASVFDDDGWFHTGDVARVDDKNFLYITGRIKELLITAGGENVGPVLIENHLRRLLKNIISNCVVIGDRQKFLSVLFTMNSDQTPEGEPLDTLSPSCVEALKASGSNATTVIQALECPKVKELLQQGIDAYNEQFSVSRAQRIQKFEILPVDFSVQGNELTPTMKLKRRVVMSQYEDIISNLYQE